MELTPIPFWNADIEIGTVHSASDDRDLQFHGPVKNLGHLRLAYAELSQINGTDRLLLELRNGDFLEFTEGGGQLKLEI